MSSQDAQMLASLDVAILHNHIQTAEFLTTKYKSCGNRSCIFAAGSSVGIADPIQWKQCPTDIHLRKEDIKALLWNAFCTGIPKMLDGTINFVFLKSPDNLFPWNITDYAEVIMDSGDHRLLKHILTTVNMQEKARYLIEYATWQQEPRMLEAILDYEVVREIIKDNQIDLRKALNNAIFRRSPRITELLLSEKTMDCPDVFNNPRPLSGQSSTLIFTLSCSSLRNRNFDSTRVPSKKASRLTSCCTKWVTKAASASIALMSYSREVRGCDTKTLV